MVVPAHVGPDAVPGRCDNLHRGIAPGDALVLAEGPGEELLGLASIGYGDGLLGELDQCGHRVMLGDRLRVAIEQGAGVGVEEFPGDDVVDLVVLMDLVVHDSHTMQIP